MRIILSDEAKVRLVKHSGGLLDKHAVCVSSQSTVCDSDHFVVLGWDTDCSCYLHYIVTDQMVEFVDRTHQICLIPITPL